MILWFYTRVLALWIQGMDMQVSRRASDQPSCTYPEDVAALSPTWSHCTLPCAACPHGHQICFQGTDPSSSDFGAASPSLCCEASSVSCPDTYIILSSFFLVCVTLRKQEVTGGHRCNSFFFIPFLLHTRLASTHKVHKWPEQNWAQRALHSVHITQGKISLNKWGFLEV